MAKTNDSLGNARAAKKDEFYTQLSDIENEMRHYRKHFKGKTVFCNCDDPFESNFFKYFVLNFNRLGLKKLIATCYTGSPIAGTQLSFEDLGKEFVGSERAYKAIVTEVYDATGNGGVDMLDVAELFRQGKNTLEELQGDGDFRSPECLALLDQADIVVTNPPFSLFREYVAMLVEHGKDFAIIGNQNAITYKEIFPLLRDNKMWLGFHSGHTLFEVPESYKIPDFYDLSDKNRLRSNGYIVDKNGKLWRNLGNICWFTNLDIKKRHEEMILVKKFNPELYPTYANFEAIEVSKAIDIPYDYAGLMGVPITFMDKYNPEQFDIIGISSALATPMKDIAETGTFMTGGPRFYTSRLTASDRTKGYKWHREYDRIVIRNRHPEQPKA